MIIIQISTEVSITLESKLEDGSHSVDVIRSVVGVEHESIGLGLLDILQKMFEVFNVAGSGVVTVPGEYVQGVHDAYHGVYHTVHQLPDDSAIRVLGALSFWSSVALSFLDKLGPSMGYGNGSPLAPVMFISLAISSIIRD